MTKPGDGKWEPPTDFDKDAQLDGDDQPTLTATAEQLEHHRALSARPDSTPVPRNAPRITAQGLTAQPRSPAASDENIVTSDFERAEPEDVVPATGSGPMPVATKRERSGATLTGLDGKGIRPPSTNGSGGLAAKDIDPATTARGIPVQPRAPGEEVVLLDRVAVSAPVEEVAQRTAGSIVVVATGADGERVRRLCHAHSILLPVMSTVSIAPGSMSVVLGEPSPPAPERVIHVVRPTVTDAQIVDLLRALVSGRVLVERPMQPTSPDPRAQEFAQRIARMQDRASIENTMIEALTLLVDADRAYCRFFDPVSGALWSESHRRTLGDNSRAMGGLVGYAAYTGQTIHASPAGDDPRFVLELDDPDGKPQSRMIVQPIIGGDLRVHAVLVAVRRWRHTVFDEAALRTIGELAALCAPALDLVASAGPRGPKFRASSTIPGPLAVAARESQVADARPSPGALATAARDSAVVDARAKRPSSRPPPVTARPPTSPPTTAQPRTPLELQSRTLAGTPVSATPVVATPLELQSRTFAGTPVSATPVVPVPIADSRPSRAPTKQPPSTSNTGRTRASSQSGPVRSKTPSREVAPMEPADQGRSRTPSGELNPSFSGQFASTGEGLSGDLGPASSGRFAVTGEGLPALPPSQAVLRARPFHQVAIVAADSEHERVQRIAKTCGVDVAIVSRTDEAPAAARIITLGQPWSPSLDPRVVYVARDSIANDALADLISATSSGRVLGAPAPLTKPANPVEARRAQQAFTGSRTFAAAASLAAAETSAVTTLRELLDIDRAYFLYFDDETGALTSALRGADDRKAIAGIAGWVARTGRAASADRGSADPRWLGPIDDPDGDPNSQLLVEPVIVGDRVRAVLVAVRRPRRPGFVDADRDLLARFAALLAPLVEQLLLHADPSAPAPSARTKRATEQAIDDLREVLPIWQRLPKWAYAVAGAGLLGAIALAASC